PRSGARRTTPKSCAAARSSPATPRCTAGSSTRSPPPEVPMPAPLVECVPNFSEGRNRETLAALERALTSVPGVALLDVQADAAHHRSVFTFVAPPDAAAEAALRAMRVATERIDLRGHRGEHPRIGATDVVPFVPVRDVTMEECVALARRFAERAAAELGIPIYLYGRAATRPERERLADLRRGEFEGLRGRLGTDPAADPDFGPPRIRPSSGGLPAVQAAGFLVGGKAQVSMNLLDIDVTPPLAVFAAVAAEARARGADIERSEVAGLIPERAVIGAGAAALKLPDAAEHLL